MEQNREPRNKPKSLWSINIYKGDRHIKWSKNSLFNKWCWEIWTPRCKKMKLDHQLTPYTKINSRWIKDLNISRDTIKVLEENVGRKISPYWKISHGKYLFFPCKNIFTDMSSRARDIKERINKWDLIKIKSFCMAKENISKMKREPTVWENIFANDTLDKGLISKIYKELTRFYSRKTNNPINWKMPKGLEQTLLQGGHTEGPETYKRMLSIASHQRDAN